MAGDTANARGFPRCGIIALLSLDKSGPLVRDQSFRISQAILEGPSSNTAQSLQTNMISFSRSYPRFSLRPVQGGFSVVELTASLAILAALALLLTASLTHWRRNVQSMQCANNLRQTGVAMALYVQDNNGSLPGPLWRGQSPYYQSAPDGSFDVASGNLVSFLAPYLNPSASSGPTLSKALSCPAWISSDPDRQHSICYYSSGELVQAEGQTLLPFGKVGESPISPMRMAAVENPAKNPALWEFDRTIASQGFYLTDPRVPDAPVHQNSRHILYFDGHAVAMNTK